MVGRTGQSVYRITIGGHLDQGWAVWLDGLAISYDDDDNTVLVGSIVDQAALRGILSRVWDLGLTLISVARSETVSGR